MEVDTDTPDQRRWDLETGERRAIKDIEHQIPLTVDDYIQGRRGLDFFDAERFRVFRVGVGWDLLVGTRDANYSSQYGAWVVRWEHWGPLVKRWLTVGHCDMTWARSETEREWQHASANFMEALVRGQVSVTSAASHDGHIPDDISQLTYAASWVGWIRDLSFECRICLNRRTDESVHAGWHNQEYHRMRRVDRFDWFCPVSDNWRQNVEIAPVYPSPTSLGYVY